MPTNNPDSVTPLIGTYAVNYVSKFGWYLFPLHSIRQGKCSCGRATCVANNQGKHPRTKAGVLDASNDVEQIRKWWAKWPDANIGLACGKSGLVVVDIDPRNGGDETLVRLEKEHGKLPMTPCQLTGGCGQHYLFARPEVERARGTSIPDGIDIKADGGYIVLAPSNHLSGRSYSWDAGQHISDTAIAECPSWVAILLRGKSDQSQSEIKPDDGYLGAAFRAAGWAGRDLGGGRIAVQCPWEAEHTSGVRFDGSTVVFAPNVGCNTGHFHCSHSHCSNRGLKQVIAKIPESARRVAREHIKVPEKWEPPPETEPNDDGDGAWQQSLRMTAEGRITKVPGNLALMLGNLPDWRGALAYNEFSGKITWVRPAPKLEGVVPPGIGEDLADHHEIYVSQWFSRHRCVDFSKEAIRAAIESAARLNRHHPLQEYLEHLVWDSVPRVDGWLSRYLGTEANETTRIMGRWWLISAVARAMQPGCQADHVLVLKGPTGAGKTAAIRTLANREWSLESVPSLRDQKDSMAILRGKWIAVFSELESVRGAALTLVKDYVTRCNDVYRPPYGHNDICVPRSCIFAGTANEQYCLPPDPTGARRWWPVAVGKIDVESLERDRDQIWAEAVHLWRLDERWWPSDQAEVALLTATQEESTLEDPWLAVLAEWLYVPGRESEAYQGHEILRQALGVTVDKITRAEEYRVGVCLGRLGWEKTQCYRYGRKGRWWCPKPSPVDR
jgi:predicted P-loop ATPase